MKKGHIFGAFFVKVFASIAYLLVHHRFYNGGDAYKYFKGGRVIYESLWEHPYYFLRLVFGKNGGFIDTPIYKYAYHTECWDHVGAYAFCRFNALLHLVSGGYYSVHTLLMAMLMLVASMLFFKLLQPLRLMPNIVLYAVVFFSFPLVFWTSGVYKEGMIYLAISCCLLATTRLAQQGVHWKNILLAFVGLGLIILCRNYLIVLLLPALFVYFIASKYPAAAAYLFGGFYLFGAVAIVGVAPYLPINIYEVLAHRQWSFLAEQGGSEFAATMLQPNLRSILAALPDALLNSTLRPFIWNANSSLQIGAAVSITLVWLFGLLAIFFRKKELKWQPLQYFLLYYAASNLLLIGLLVANSGTIMRYRVIAMHYIIILIASQIKWSPKLQ